MPEPEQLDLGVPGRARRSAVAPGPSVPMPAAIGRYGAAEIAVLLTRPEPTAEQCRVIEAPATEPLLVVAGAGSGKTETMAARVVWLVANGFYAADEILGLTFTRKAAGELADRVRARLRALHRRGLLPQEPASVRVSTYNAYAAAVVRDHGLRLGIEPGARLLGEAGAWQLATEVVRAWEGEVGDLSSSLATLTDQVLNLAGECAEHLVDPGFVREFGEDLIGRLVALPGKLGELDPGKPRAPVRDALAVQAHRGLLTEMVRAFEQRKREMQVLDFADQVALAARLARDLPEVRAGERAGARMVLLDEFQDTSVAQLAMLRGLFGDGHPVVAVGDPNQAIYGWRGASAGNLAGFAGSFARTDGAPADTLYLSTSWRNDRRILAVANEISAPLRASIPPLLPGPKAMDGLVQVGWYATVEEEATATADMIAAVWAHRDEPSAEPPMRTAAVLCRRRAQFLPLETALLARGLPVEIVGLGGLLHRPEIVDLRAALEVTDDPGRGDSLMRLLTGASQRLGARDLRALALWSRQAARAAGRPGRHRGSVGVRPAPDSVDEPTIVEGLDALPLPDWAGPGGETFSVEGYARLGRLAVVLRELRSRAALPLPDLVGEAERLLGLDLEVAARPGVTYDGARAGLEAFAEVAAGFAAERESGTLGAFLAWLQAAESRERGLDAPTSSVREDAVQLMTVHAAKGLEWDLVVVPGLVEGGFPIDGTANALGVGGGETDRAWLGRAGALPYPLRGDRVDLPEFAEHSAQTQVDLARALEAFILAAGAYAQSEERRLAYVALTRARHRLILSGSQWGDPMKPRTVSRFLVQAAGVSGVQKANWEPDPAPDLGNPRAARTASALWPVDPLGDRRTAVEQGAAWVREAMSRSRLDDGSSTLDERAPASAAPTGEDTDPWAQDIERLLAERARRRSGVLEVALPGHLSASRLVNLAQDPQGLAEHLRRPMPRPPSPAARRGSAFHLWLENRFRAEALLDLDDLPGASDDFEGDVDLDELQKTFLAGEWADRTPVAVEVPVETPVGGLVVRGRIDAVFAGAPAESVAQSSTVDEVLVWDVVDWKTGRPPSDPSEADARAVQLAIYRLAWARLQSVPVHRVRAAFYYASTGETVRPVQTLDEEGLAELIARATAAVPQPLTQVLTQPMAQEHLGS